MSEPRDTKIEVERLGDGRFSVVDGHIRRLGYAAAKDGITWVWLEGRAYVISNATQERSRRAGDDDLALAAPMPATVRTIPVTAGQHVRADDVLVVLEAMKMELAIKAPRDGVIAAIRCAVGDIVQPGIPLVELS